jgi:deoxyribodipyrimidine photo-lyase
MSTIVWLRHDLRLADNAAFDFAVQRGGPVWPVFIAEPHGPWSPGGAARVWLHDSLAALAQELAAVGSRLVIRQGEALDVLRELQAETGATALAFNARMEPAGRARDERVRTSLATALQIKVGNSSLLCRPDRIATGSGGPYRVFTPFWRQVYASLRQHPTLPLSAPAQLPAPDRWPASLTLESLALLPAKDWPTSLRQQWPAGAAVAHRVLAAFLDEAVDHYAVARDFPALPGVSRLSPYLHNGQISPRQVWHAVHERAAARGALEPSERELSWLRQLVWREFAHHLLWHFPTTPDAPLRPEFEAFPWCDDEPGYRRWCRGETGFPMVDAGMRELWQTGLMHNRVRMIVASFLTKDLGVHWRRGAQWFWDTLMDANLANNTLGWQWTAGCGADAAPYFRVFNPITQSQKFDPDGAYLARWLPELAALSPADRHAPWLASPLVLKAAGFELGRDYPAPMLDHAAARHAALARLEQSKR